MVVQIGDKNVPSFVDRKTGRKAHRRSDSRSTIARIPGGTVAGDRRNNPGRTDPADTRIIDVIGEEDAACTVHRDSFRIVELGGGSGTTITRKPGDTGPCDRRDQAWGIEGRCDSDPGQR